MNPLMDLLREAGHALIGMLTLPYLYIAVAFAWWHAKQATTLQRHLFHVRLYPTLLVTMRRTLAGFAVGLGVSLLGLGAGARLDGTTLLCVWIATVALLLFKLRYICLAYAAGALGVLKTIAVWCGLSADDGVVFKALLGVDVPGLLFLAGLLHVAEGLLVRWQGAKFAVPLFIEGKRGKPLGAYWLSGVWPVPLLWLVPASSGGFSLPWPPLSDLDGSVAGWTLAAFPVLIGFSSRTETRWPERQAKDTSGTLIGYGLVVAGLAAGAWFWTPLGIVAAVCAFALHEGLVWWSRRREVGRQPIYVQDGSGMTVLAVLPGTPAAEMGLLAGERILKVNGAKVRTKEQLYGALQLQSAYCRLEVVNREGHTKFVQRARYQGEHYQLGLILAPDEDADWVAAPRPASIWQGLRRGGARRRKVAAARLAALAEANRAAPELAAATASAGGGEAIAAADAVAAPEAGAALESAVPAPAADPNALPPRGSKRH